MIYRRGSSKPHEYRAETMSTFVAVPKRGEKSLHLPRVNDE